MKKAILLLLFACINSVAFALEYWEVPDREITITATKGVAFTINPRADLGLQADQITAFNGPTTSPDPANICSITAIREAGAANTFHYYYTLTPFATGSFNFRVQLFYRYTPNGGGLYYSSTAYVNYIITIVDLTSISIPQSVDMYVDDEYTFNPIISHPNAYSGLTWRSENPAVATINEQGKVKAVSLGSTSIFCTAFNGVSTLSQINVNPRLVTGITLNQSECTMAIEDNLQLSAEVAPEDATDKSISWSSSNEDIAVVDENGLVTAVSTGTCNIKATTNDGSGKYASCKITVMRDNRLTLKDITICAGGYDMLHVRLKNEDNVYGFQFDLSLPEGMSVSEDENGKLIANITTNSSSHTISSNKISEGLYRFVVVSLTGKSISPQDDDIMTIAVNTSNEMVNGKFDIALKSIGITVKNGTDYEELNPLDKKASLTVAPVIPGDVNGDSNISVTDVISIISYVLEERPNKFLTPAADMNSDGNITVTDAVSVIDNILGK